MRDFDGTEVIETTDCVFFWKPPAVYSHGMPSVFTADGIPTTAPSST